jgi:AcrR family transcriptional regulator
MSSQPKRGRPRTAETGSSASTRDNLLKAAEEVVVTDGAQALTLDAVYKRAGVSKGGLLYHFPNKEALIDGMIERYIERSRAEEEALRNIHEPAVPGASSRATIAQLSAGGRGHGLGPTRACARRRPPQIRGHEGGSDRVRNGGDHRARGDWPRSPRAAEAGADGAQRPEACVGGADVVGEPRRLMTAGSRSGRERWPTGCLSRRDGRRGVRAGL